MEETKKDNIQFTPPGTQPPVKFDVLERLADSDKAVLDQSKSKRELALSEAKLAVSKSENTELAYNNIILQLALKYKLVDGDVIEESGEIKRKK
jgi:hypothetical protein